MAEIKNPEAYFGTMVRNSYKDEFRANDNFFKHISSVGDEADIQQEFSEPEKQLECDTDFIERQLSELSVENWLLFMENERLHKALSSLPMAEVEFLLELVAGFKLNQTAFAKANGVSRQSVSKRFRRLRNKILEIL